MMKTMLAAFAMLGAVACAPLPPGVGVTVDEPGFGLAVGAAAPPAYYGPAYGPPVAYVPAPPVIVERRFFYAPRFERPHWDRGRGWGRGGRWGDRRGHRD